MQETTLRSNTPTTRRGIVDSASLPIKRRNSERHAWRNKPRSSEPLGLAKVDHRDRAGNGHFDLQAYTDYFAGKLQDYEYPEEEVAMALAGLPSVE